MSVKTGSEMVDAAIFLSDDKVAAATRAGSVCVWHVHSGQLLVSATDASTNSTYGMALSPSGEFFACASTDKTVRVWKCEAMELVSKCVTSGVLESVLFLDDETLVVPGKDGVMSMVDVQSGSIIKSFPGQSGRILAIAAPRPYKPLFVLPPIII